MPHIILAALSVILTFSQIDENIAKLSSDDYSTRENATLTLRKQGFDILPRLAEEIYKTKDLETKYRCQGIIDYYTILPAETLPVIWFLPNEYRYKDDVDLAIKYYREEVRRVNKLSIRVKPDDYEQEFLAKRAMQRLIQDILTENLSIDRRVEILDLKWKIKGFYLQYNNYTNVYGHSIIYDDITMPIEVLLEKYERQINGQDLNDIYNVDGH